MIPKAEARDWQVVGLRTGGNRVTDGEPHSRRLGSLCVLNVPLNKWKLDCSGELAMITQESPSLIIT